MNDVIDAVNILIGEPPQEERTKHSIEYKVHTQNNINEMADKINISYKKPLQKERKKRELYYFLEDGDVIDGGDEVYTFRHRWEIVMSYGKIYNSNEHGPMRRQYFLD